ncbi:hypothetical protein BD309DRAFT_556642 [Dichomitus squalens]|nr:hypothetical protein BD309DRAFT_556642 [Dichomitus squalens]
MWRRMYGLTMHQGYRYMHLPFYKSDSNYIKIMVSYVDNAVIHRVIFKSSATVWHVVVVLLIETVHSILSMHACYYYFTTNHFYSEVLFHGSWSINLLPMSTGIVIAVSQSFFARRLFKINSKYAPIVGFVVGCY